MAANIILVASHLIKMFDNIEKWDGLVEGCRIRTNPGMDSSLWYETVDRPDNVINTIARFSLVKTTISPINNTCELFLFKLQKY